MERRPNYYHLKNPCVMDVDTEIGQISLMMDKDYPQFIFVSIDGELRKCIDLSETDVMRFQNDEQVYQYLDFFQATRDFDEIINVEKEIKKGWEDL